jgi:ketosteroid isomerase-like protein
MTGATIGTLSSADHAAIRDVHTRFPDLLVRQNFAALARLYTQDTVFMPPHHPAVHGRAALEGWMTNFPRVLRMTLNVDEIDGRADIAYVRGTYAMTIHPDGAPTPVDDAGKFLEICKRQPDGSWLVAADIFNSDNA